MAVLSLDSKSGFLARSWKGWGFGFFDRVGFRDRIYFVDRVGCRDMIYFVDRVGFRDKICFVDMVGLDTGSVLWRYGRFCRMKADGHNRTEPEQI
jgi:hypothetical protein